MPRDDQHVDGNADQWDRELDEWLARHGLHPDPNALPEIRALLAEQAELERAAYADELDEDVVADHELMKLLCTQLFGFGRLEDVPLIWYAKERSMDTAYAIDIQMLCGAGLEETETYLAANGPGDALDYLRSCRAAGDFEGFTPAARMAEYERYYFGA